MGGSVVASMPSRAAQERLICAVTRAYLASRRPLVPVERTDQPAMVASPSAGVDMRWASYSI